MSEVRLFLLDLFYLPQIGWGIWGTFLRGMRELRVKWVNFFFHGIFEPVLIFVAFGLGLGSLVPAMQEQSYIEFLLPGLVVVYGFATAYFEASHGSFDRIGRRVYESALRLGIRSDEIILGEVLLATFKGVLTVISLMMAGYFMNIDLGRIDISAVPIGLSVLSGAALGVFVSSLVRDHSQFSLWSTVVVVPLILFSGSYFPVNIYPFWSQSFLEFVPMVQSVKTVRMAFDGDFLPEFFLCIALMILPICLFLNLGAARWHRRFSELSINKVHRYEYKD